MVGRPAAGSETRFLAENGFLTPPEKGPKKVDDDTATTRKP
jgi:hypothetical protein